MIKKLIKRKQSNKPELPSRITNDTVAAHREKVLAGGRKHKYPLQYTKHKLVWNTVIITVLALILAIVGVYARLYKFNDTGDLSYRITNVLPLPVASVDGHSVNYGKYLMYQRASMKSLSNTKHNIGEDERKFKSKQALDNSIIYTYAEKVANEKKISVSDNQVDDWVAKQQKASGLSDISFKSVVAEQFGWSLNEMKRSIRDALVLREVKFSVDNKARAAAENIKNLVAGGSDLKTISEQLGQQVRYIPEINVPKNNSDGGLTIAASKSEEGKIVGPLKLGNSDGYYFIQLHGKDEKTVRYSYMVVPLTEFDAKFKHLKSTGKINYYIKL